MSNIRETIGKTLLHYNNGSFLLRVFTGVFAYATFVKVYNLPFWWNFVIAPVALVLTVIGGILYERLGIRKAYDQEATKYFVVGLKDEQK